MDKNQQSDDMLKRIRDELNAIMEGNNSNDPKRRISYEDIMKPTPLPTIEPSSNSVKSKSAKKAQIYHNPQSHRQAIGGKSITMKPSSDRLSGGRKTSRESLDRVSSGTSATSLEGMLANLERSMPAELLEPPANTSIDEDLQKMQLELGKSYELFQSIGEKFEAIDFSSLKSSIRTHRLNNMANDIGNAELKKEFESRYMQNRLDTLTENVSSEFRRHPGEFGDIPELSTFFQTCAQLERGLDTLKKQRKLTNELENRLCWATEIAYDRMDEIRNSVGDKPETNF